MSVSATKTTQSNQNQAVHTASPACRQSANPMFNAHFLAQHTNNQFTDFGTFVAAGFPDTDFESIPNDQWAAWIKRHTNFTSWNEMKSAALKAYMTGRLTFH